MCCGQGPSDGRRLAFDATPPPLQVSAVCSLLRGGCREPPLSPCYPPAAAFFDALDTVLTARLSVARQASQGSSHEHDRRALDEQHLAAICGELAKLGAYPCAALT